MNGEDSNDNSASSPGSPASNASATETSHQALKQLVLNLLYQHPLGLSEHELIKAVQAADHLLFNDIELWDSLSLFQTHFVLFHVLYTLRQELWQQRSYTLEISPLKIVLLSWDESAKTDAGSEMTEHDPLQDYYLDLNNLVQTSAQDVTDMLASFWMKLAANEQRNEALKVLGLEDPVDFAAIKKQYRRLAMQHHPDRGGDDARLQTLNTALDILQRCEIKKVLQ